MNLNDADHSALAIQQIARHIPGIIYIAEALADGRVRFRYVSESVEAIIGWTVEEITDPRFDIFELLDEAQAADLRVAVMDATRRMSSLTREVRLRTKSGGHRWLRFSSTPTAETTPEGGDAITWHGVVLDITDRIEAQASLAAAHHRLHDLETIINRGPAVAFVWRVEEGWPVEYVTKNVKQFGYTAEQLLAGDVSWPAITHRDDVARLEADVAEHIEQGHDSFGQRYRLIGGDGQVRWVEDRTFAVRDASGKLTHFQGVIIDVTDREQAIQALHESRRFIQKIADTTPVMLFVWDMQTWQPIYQNPQVRIQLGYTDAHWEAIRTQPGIATPLEDLPLQKRFFDDLRAAADGQIVEGEYRTANAVGDMRWVRIRGMVFERRPNGAVSSVVSTVMDVTDRHESEAAARASESLFRSMLKAVPDVVLVFDADGRYLSVFTEKPHLLFLPPDQLIGKTVDDIVDAKIAAEIKRTIRQALKTGQVQNYEYTLPIDGEERCFAAGVVPFETDDEPRVLWVARDETRRRQMQLQVEAHQHQLESLAAQLTLAEERERRRIAVDLHDHIGQTLSLTQIKLGAIDDSTLTASDRAALRDSVDLIRQTIFDARSLMFELSPPILYDLGLEAAIEWLAEQHQQEHCLSVELAMPDDRLPFDETTAVLLFRVVRELMTNIVKHAQASTVNIAIKRRGERALITVRDDGVGMRPDATNGQRTAGKHFGLFNVRQQIERLGGTINIRSTRGKGTSVTVETTLALAAP
jgi:PAS domain S-box-containing protein